ncbi:MAG: isocitrate lyase/phosphoenolpyruvate mutase family protein [Phycisphaerales bacterium JB043]
MNTPQEHPGTRLRALMHRQLAVMPGAFNGLVARAVADAGFQATYVSGGAVSAASGVPDIGLRTLDHFTRVIREVADGSGLPLIADADTGFGEGEMTARTVVEYSRAGAAGCHLEDQVFPKRCGHLEGKTLVATEHFCEKLEYACKARDGSTNGQFIVCARTDAAAIEGLEGAIARATAYVHAGADMIFPEALTEESHFAEFARAMQQLAGDAPTGGPYLLAHMSEFGKTPVIHHDRLRELGYHCCIHPVSTLRLAMGAIIPALARLRTEGTIESSLQSMQSRNDLYALLGYNPGEPWTFPNSPQHAEDTQSVPG